MTVPFDAEIYCFFNFKKQTPSARTHPSNRVGRGNQRRQRRARKRAEPPDAAEAAARRLQGPTPSVRGAPALRTLRSRCHAGRALLLWPHSVRLPSGKAPGPEESWHVAAVLSEEVAVN